MKILAVGAKLFSANRSIDGQRNRYDEANSRPSQFFERA